MGVQINGDTGNVIATKGTFSGDVGIGGTLTYEDVTNIDAVGLVTARNGIEIGARPGVAASISVDGNMIVSGISTFGGVITGRGELRLTEGTSSTSNGDEIGSLMYLHPVTNNKNAKIVALHNGGSSGADLAFFTRTQADGTNTDGGEERLRITSDGYLLVNTDTSRGVGNATGRLLQVEGTGVTAGMSIVRNSNDDDGCSLHLGKSRSSSVGGNTIVQDGDELGNIRFFGADGTDLITPGAIIQTEVDGTPGSNDMPGRIIFKTNDNTSFCLERVRIDSSGLVGIGGSSTGAALHVVGGGGKGIKLVDGSNSGGAPNFEIISKRSDSNGNTSFSSNIFLGKNRTDQKVTSGIILGTVNFGGNHTDGTEGNISYSAAIRGVASNSFDSKTDMPTDMAFCTGTSGTDISGELAGQSNVGTERMRINSAGIVTKPYTPSFSAKGSTDAIVAQSPLPFDSTGGINHNNGNHYNTTTYKFTCPVDGYYYVTCHVVPTNYDVGANVELYVADNSGNRHFLDRKVKTSNYASNNFSVGGSRIIYKASGSTLWVELNSIHGSPTLEGSSHFGITLIA